MTDHNDFMGMPGRYARRLRSAIRESEERAAKEAEQARDVEKPSDSKGE